MFTRQFTTNREAFDYAMQLERDQWPFVHICGMLVIYSFTK